MNQSVYWKYGNVILGGWANPNILSTVTQPQPSGIFCWKDIFPSGMKQRPYKAILHDLEKRARHLPRLGELL